MTVVADPVAVSFIAERGGQLYVYADRAGMKHVRTEPPRDSSIRFEQIEADGFLMYLEDDIEQPDTWNVKFRRLPYHHVDVLWDGDQPGPGASLGSLPLSPDRSGVISEHWPRRCDYA